MRASVHSPANYLRARATFFVRVAQVKTATERRCEHTMPLFPLALILEADGTLADLARHIAEKVQA